MSQEEENQVVIESTEDNTVNVLNMSDEEFTSMDFSADNSAENAPSETNESNEEESVPEVNSEQEDTSTFDYEAEYKRLLEPFKANGKEIKVDSIDDARQLMQMGANYTKKMTALKPNLKIMKMLEQNELLDEGKLNYLIDLNKKNPEAIRQLLKDSGLDPLDIDTSSESQYKPNTYTVDDKQIELDEVLEGIQDTPQFKDTVHIIKDKWDTASKNVLSENPKLIATINEHIGTGIYQQINTVVEQQRILGRLNDVSDLEAYRLVGEYLQENNLFQNQVQQLQVVTPQVIQPVSKPIDTAIKQKKQAASSTKPAITKTTSNDFNPLAMSDEEFMNMYNKI